MADSQVREIELKSDGSIALTIEVQFEAGATVELSGSATQPNGAIATFDDRQVLPPAEPGGGSLVTVTANPSATVTAIPSPKFDATEVITATVCAVCPATTWVTVLSQNPNPENQHPEAEAVWTAMTVWTANPDTG
jgi:hypothetical protein